MDSLNSLDRLLEAEAKAAELIRAAEAEAGSILSEAGEALHAVEKARVAELRSRHDAAITASESEVKQKLKSELDDYGKRLEAIPVDEAAFARSCRIFMSAGA